MFAFELKTPCNIAVIGSTMSGKSVFCSKLLKQMEWDYLMIVSPTMKVNGDYSEFKERKGKNQNVFKYDTMSDFLFEFEEFKKQQEDIIREFEKEEVPSIVCLIDDCANDSLLRFNGAIDKYAVKSRHYNISMIMVSQRLNAIPANLRLNCAYMVLFSVFNLGEIEKFITQYVMKHRRKNLINKLENIYRNDYNFVMCDNFAQDWKKRLYKNGRELINLDS